MCIWGAVDDTGNTPRRMGDSSTASRHDCIDPTSSTLLARVCDQDAEAWRMLVRLYEPLIEVWILRAKLRPPDVRDVCQEVFAAVSTAVSNFHKDRPGDSFRAWLRTIVRHKIVDFYRQAANQPGAIGGTEAMRRLDEIADVSTATDSLQDPTEREALRWIRQQALENIRGEFEPHTWQAFWRLAIDRVAAKDVAHEMGMTAPAVRMAKSRVLRRLREELGDVEL
jgi:RNA polymerase sigma-70 factor (ECF subfamily)